MMAFLLWLLLVLLVFLVLTVPDGFFRRGSRH